MAWEHQGLVHQPPAVVGSPHPGLLYLSQSGTCPSTSTLAAESMHELSQACVCLQNLVCSLASQFLHHNNCVCLARVLMQYLFCFSNENVYMTTNMRDVCPMSANLLEVFYQECATCTYGHTMLCWVLQSVAQAWFHVGQSCMHHLAVHST